MRLKKLELRNAMVFEEAVLDFAVPAAHAAGPGVVREPRADGSVEALVQTAFLYGPPAGGKTCLLRAAADLSRHFSGPRRFDDYEPMLFRLSAPAVKRPGSSYPDCPLMQARWTFLINGREVVYGYAKEEVPWLLLEESLSIDGETVFEGSARAPQFMSAPGLEKRGLGDAFAAWARTTPLGPCGASLLNVLGRRKGAAAALPEAKAILDFGRSIVWLDPSAMAFWDGRAMKDVESKAVELNRWEKLEAFLRRHGADVKLGLWKRGHGRGRSGAKDLVFDFPEYTQKFREQASTRTLALAALFQECEEMPGRMNGRLPSLVLFDGFDDCAWIDGCEEILKEIRALPCQAVLAASNTHWMQRRYAPPEACWIAARGRLAKVVELARLGDPLAPPEAFRDALPEHADGPDAAAPLPDEASAKQLGR